MGSICTLPIPASQVKPEITSIHRRIIDSPDVKAHARVGNHLWYVYCNTEGPYVGVNRLAVELVTVHKEDGGLRSVCRKGYDESSHPFHYSAPARLVKMCPVPSGTEWAGEWRAEWERRRKAKPDRPWESWSVGARITDGTRTWVYQGPCPNRRLGIRITDDQGGRFRLPLVRCRRLAVVTTPAAA